MTNEYLGARRRQCFRPEPDSYQRKPDITLAMSGETWVKVYLSQALPEDLIKKGDIKVKGDAAEAARLINLFDTSPRKRWSSRQLSWITRIDMPVMVTDWARPYLPLHLISRALGPSVQVSLAFYGKNHVQW